MPAVRGGATETLIDILIKQNEIQGRLNLHVLSKFDEDAALISRNFMNTKFHFYKSRADLGFLPWLFDFNLFLYIAECITSFFRRRPAPPPRYYFYAFQLCKRLEIDFFVAEGGIYEHYDLLREILPPQRRFAHLHRVVDGNNDLWEVFPNAIAISEFVARAYETRNKPVEVNVSLVRNCCNVPAFMGTADAATLEALRKRFGFTSQDFVVIFSGRVVKEKGVLELLNAVELITNPNIKVLIVGSSFFAGAPETDYLSLVRRKARLLGQRVAFAGFVPNNQLRDHFLLSSACVVPSIWDEPSALVPLEAMNCGVPTIITDSGGMIEYQKEDCVVVVERGPDLADQIALAITKLCENVDYRARIKEAGIQRAKDFSIENFYEEFVRVFESQQL